MVQLSNHLAEEERAGCLTLTVVWLLCYVSLSRGAMGWFAVCDCGILFFFRRKEDWKSEWILIS